MNLFDRMVISRPASFFKHIFVVSEADDYREHPMDLPEKMMLRSVRGGAKIPGAEALTKFKAKLPEFKDLEAKGFVKHHAVLRSRKADDDEAAKRRAETEHQERLAQWKAADKKARGPKPKKARSSVEQPGQYQGRKVAVHYWENPDTGERTKAKIVNPSSPWKSRM